MQSCWRSPNATACSGGPADGSGTSKEEKELDEHENQLADEVLELEERTEEILLRQYKFTSRKLELTTEVKIEHSCCKKLAAQLKPAKIELGRIYEACTNPTARKCAMLEMGIALNTGTVIAGNIGSERRSKYGFVGHAMNVTSRIEDVAGRGEILIADSTRDALGAEYELGDLRELTAKGIDETLQVYPLKREIL